MNYINASCITSGNRIVRDGKVLFEQAGGGSAQPKEASSAAPAGLPDFLASAYRHFDLQYPKFYKMDTLSKLGWLTAELLLQGFPRDRYVPESVGLVLSNANASLDTDIRYWETVKEIPSPAVFVYTLPNIVAGEICIRHQWKGENAFFVSPDFDAPLVHWYTADLLDNGRLDACVCGWIDVSEECSRAILFLVEKQPRPGALPFTAESLRNIPGNP
jgi:hypothetical protein